MSGAPAVDEPRAVRPGEELDVAALAAALGTSELHVEQFPGGFSNLTYAVRGGDRELVLRKPPRGASAKGGHDMKREHDILAALAQTSLPVPRPVAFIEDAGLLVMERVRGVILRPGSKVQLAPEVARGLSTSTVDRLAELHAVDASSPAIAALGHGAGYVERQVKGWSERYAKARTDDVPAIEQLASWLAAHLPLQRDATLIHNDYKYDNLVLAPDDLTRILAILDWEMATVGDPLMDLGTTLAYWVDPDDPAPLKMLPFPPTLAPGTLRRAELVQRYAAMTGRDPGDALFYYCFGLFKIAVIAQQIYARYARGLTKDERFAGLLMAVHALGAHAALALDRKRIDNLG